MTQATEEAPVTAEPRRRGRPRKKITTTQAEYEETVRSNVADANSELMKTVAALQAQVAQLQAAQAQAQPAPQPTAAPAPQPLDLGPPERFMDWPAHMPAPKGFQKIKQVDGTFILERQPKNKIDMMARDRVLAKVDKAWEHIHKPTEEYPDADKQDPAVLFVNRAWRKLFRNQATWGEKTMIEVDEARFENSGQDKAEPQFEFVREEPKEPEDWDN